MKTVEIQEKQWKQFCDRMEQFCRGAMVTIHLENGDVAKAELAVDLPLRHIVLDEESDACNTRLVIEVGLADAKPTRHEVIEPIHIRLKNGTDPNRYNIIQVLAENGTTTLEIRPGLNESLLKGLTA
jgi:hypothetical protein